MLDEPAGRFDGIAAARFDYPNGRAYLSVPFAATSDDLYLRITDAAGALVGTFLSIARFYDNRQAAVVCTYDDWGRDLPSVGLTHPACLDCVEAHQAVELWASIGINSAEPSAPLTAAQWDEMDAAVAGGWFEPINHGKTHMNGGTYADQADADAEIVEGGALILANVTMPPQSRRGATQFLQGWIRPNGGSTAVGRSTLASSKYLSDRSGEGATIADFTAWAADGLYDTQTATVRVLFTSGASGADETAAADLLITRFDAAYAEHGIFIAYTYPHYWPGGWGVGSEGRRWLDYIGAVDDIWSVGYGHLYQYRLVSQAIEVEAPPRFESYTAKYGGTGAGPVIMTAAKPEGTEEGDLLLAHHFDYAGTETGPAGWTLLARETTGLRESVWWKVATGAEPDEYSWESTDTNASFKTLTILRYSGTDTTSPIRAFARNYESTSDDVVTAPAVTTTGGTVCVRIWSAPSCGRVVTPTDTADAVLDRAIRLNAAAGRGCHAIADQWIPSGQTPAAMSAAMRTAQTARHGWTIVLRPA